MNKNIKSRAYRALFYGIGVVLLAVGLTLNTKTGLGTAPIITVPFAMSKLWSINFAGCVFAVYTIMTCLQFLIRRKLSVFLQLPFSVVFSILLNYFGNLLDFRFAALWQNILLLAAAIIITAIGVALMVNMKLIANPADGFANTVGEILGKGMGFGKNVVDLSCVAITAVLTLAASGHLIGIGVGTLISMIGVGRAIAVFNSLCKEKITSMAGVEWRLKSQENQ